MCDNVRFTANDVHRIGILQFFELCKRFIWPVRYVEAQVAAYVKLHELQYGNQTFNGFGEIDNHRVNL